MYLPKHNRIEDRSQIFDLIRIHSFGILVTSQNDLPFATHLPFVLDEHRGPHGVLSSHMARANPQWLHFQTGKQVLVVFQGPHTYISPTWYHSEFNVPTWNYAVVHVYGTVRLIEDPSHAGERLDQLVSQYEGHGPDAWTVPWADTRYEKLVGGVVTFEIEINQLEGKWKIGQNKSLADQQGVIQHLQQMTTAPSMTNAVHVANLMCQHLNTQNLNTEENKDEENQDYV